MTDDEKQLPKPKSRTGGQGARPVLDFPSLSIQYLIRREARPSGFTNAIAANASGTIRNGTEFIRL
ncbi:hypothetical protein SAMN05216525_14759 [Bradyrhizobium sp. Gha]|nr:hypothetical protein SAMN05216525_14759 [Bradyrhizobium sp. Gha]